MNSEQAAELNEQAVRRLIDAHARLDEPLLLAIRYKINEPGIHLLEVLDGFPGDENADPLETEYGSSPEVRMIGTLKLALVNARQFRAMIQRKAPIIDALKQDGRVEFYAGAGKDLAELTGLKNGASSSKLAALRRLISEEESELSPSELEEFRRNWA